MRLQVAGMMPEEHHMPSDRKPSLILPVDVMALLLGYFWAYFHTVVCFRELLSGTVEPGYPTLGASRVWRIVFAPAHLVDRLIRPDFWKPPQ
jgi:hypothetical protein